jgi:hypothetical protein
MVIFYWLMDVKILGPRHKIMKTPWKNALSTPCPGVSVQEGKRLLLRQGERRYNAWQAGFGGQTKLIFRKTTKNVTLNLNAPPARPVDWTPSIAAIHSFMEGMISPRVVYRSCHNRWISYHFVKGYWLTKITVHLLNRLSLINQKIYH